MNGSNLVIVEKYNEFVEYVYPCIQNVDRRHGVLKMKMIDAMFLQVELFYKAIKSNQKSKLYEADANLAVLRYYLRFLAHPKRKLISMKQHQVASVKIAEVGNILNAWIKKA